MGEVLLAQDPQSDRPVALEVTSAELAIKMAEAVKRRADGLFFYNLWHLFLRLLEPGRPVESAGGRRWFLLIAARLVQSGRQKTLQVSVSGRWWEQLRAGYERVCAWLAATAPQLKSGTLTVPLPPPIGSPIA